MPDLALHAVMRAMQGPHPGQGPDVLILAQEELAVLQLRHEQPICSEN